MKIPLVDLRAQYSAISEEMHAAIENVLQRGDFILGKEVQEFEDQFSQYCGVPSTITVATGTDALHLALLACGIRPGDEVITAPNSFVATASAISFCGAVPVFADVTEQTGTIDSAAVRKAITKKTRAMIPVHLYGHPADMDPLLQLGKEYGIRIIEDACQAHGARYKGKRVGSIGDAAAFSFYPSKNLGCYGDGGAITTGDSEIARQVQMLRNYGQVEKYKHDLLAFNSRMDTIHAAALLVKLKYLDHWNSQRREAAQLYTELLQGTELVPPVTLPDCEPVFYLYVVRTRERDRILGALQSAGIGASIHYPVPIHLQKVYSHLGYGPGAFPIAEKWCSDALSLPIFPEITPEQIRYICNHIRI